MAYHKLDVTKSEMLKLREQGLSNKDIANVLDIHYSTVVKYIGKQGRKMESMAAFKEKAPVEEAPVETPEVKRAVDQIVICTEMLSSKNGNVLAEVDHVAHVVDIKLDKLTFDELEELAVFIVGMVEHIKGVKK